MIDVNYSPFPKTHNNLSEIDPKLHHADPVSIIEWAAKTFGDGLIMSTSFGIDSAVMLHMVTRIIPSKYRVLLSKIGVVM